MSLAPEARFRNAQGEALISVNLRLWDGSLPRRGRRTQPGVLTPAANIGDDRFFGRLATEKARSRSAS